MESKILRDISYGMYVVTTSYNDKLVGCIINTVTQVTSSNPIISMSLNKDNYTNEVIKNTKKFVVNILSEKTIATVIKTFGFKTSKEVNKFENCKYEIKDGLPVLKEGICGYIVCELISIVDAESHDIFIARIVDMNKTSDNIPMTYKYYHEVIKGVTPKNAPTFIVKTEQYSNCMYRCNKCGYIYNDAEESIHFDKLPDNWKCPVCGAPKSEFERM